MPLIDLKLIRELVTETGFDKRHTQIESYNWTSLVTPLDSATFMRMVKTNNQAENLCGHLEDLHQECADFVAGEIQKYIDEYDNNEQHLNEGYDPFDDLGYHFDTEIRDSLPPMIEQYGELFFFANQFSKVQSGKRTVFGKGLGDNPKGYLAINEHGDTVMIPESEMTEAFLTRAEINQRIVQIEIEYCLDGYNRFYTQCAGLLKAHHRTGDVRGCASEILGLYKVN